MGTGGTEPTSTPHHTLPRLRHILPIYTSSSQRGETDRVQRAARIGRGSAPVRLPGKGVRLHNGTTIHGNVWDGLECLGGHAFFWATWVQAHARNRQAPAKAAQGSVSLGICCLGSSHPSKNFRHKGTPPQATADSYLSRLDTPGINTLRVTGVGDLPRSP